MVKRIFIRVVGFTGAERHALNTVFRLSQEPESGRRFSYEPWLAGNPEAPSLALIDGASGSASQELTDLHHNHGMGLIWVGAVSPSKAWRTFSRPLRWPEVLTAMDQYFEPKPESGADPADADWPAPTPEQASQQAPEQVDTPIEGATLSVSWPAADTNHRALIADLDPQARRDLRSALAAMGFAHVDEASSVAETQALLGQHGYQLVSVDLNLPDLSPWIALDAAHLAPLRIVTGLSIGLRTKLTAKLHDCIAMQKPLDTDRLGDLLLNL
jgi:CheY-like chemotaxis protein